MGEDAAGGRIRPVNHRPPYGRIASAAVLVVLGLSPSARAQEGVPARPSREALQRVLNGKVEDWTDDGFLTLRYPFDSADELKDFEVREAGGAGEIRVDNGRLVLKKGELSDDRGGIRCGELHWQAPFSLRFSVMPRWPDSGLMVIFSDTSERGGQTIVVINGSDDHGPGERFHGVVRTSSASRFAFPGPRGAARGFDADKAHEVAITVEDGELTLAVGGRRIGVERRFFHESFQVLMFPTGSAIEADDLRFHGRPVEASVRKILRGGAAKETSEAREIEDGQTAAAILGRERLQEHLPAAVRRALSGLEAKPRELVVQARKAETGFDLRDAANLYQEAAVLAPDSAVVAWRAGRALLLTGEAERALEALELATRLDPELAGAWRDLGQGLDTLERDEEALAALTRAAELDPEDVLALTLRGVQLFGMSRLAEAQDMFRQALELKPDAAAAQRLLRDVDRLQAPPPWEPSFRSESAHYTVTTNVSEEFAARVGRELERYRVFLEGIVPLPEGRRAERSRAWIFDSRGEYNIFAGTLLSRTVERTAGVYHPAIRTLLLFDEVDRESTFDTLFHEGFHQYLDLVNRRAPIWFNEGMAEFFGATRFDADGNGRPGIQLGRLAELQSKLRSEPEQVPDFDELVRMPKIRFYDLDRITLNYAVAWSLCFYFLAAPETGDGAEARALFRDYSAAVFAGRPPEEAYAASFGREGARRAESFKPAWRSFINRLR